jgi:hypothetical protein
MQKKKSNKDPKVSKFDPNELSHMFFDASVGVATDSTMDHSIGQLASSAMTTAIELSKIVIENRVRNTENMIDEDIYKIYKQSFATIITAVSVTEN